jgi:hypothetical protein
VKLLLSVLDTSPRFALDKLRRIVQDYSDLQHLVAPEFSKIVDLMKSRDVSIARPAIGLLAEVADESSTLDIFVEIITYVPMAPLSIRELLIVSAVRLCNSSEDADPALILDAIPYVSQIDNDEIWTSLAKSAVADAGFAGAAFESASNSIVPNETIGQVAAFQLGETGSDWNAASGFFVDVFASLSPRAQSIIVTAIVKFTVRHNLPKAATERFLQENLGSLDHEVAQRCREYLALLRFPDPLLAKLILRTNEPETQQGDPLAVFEEQDQGELYRDSVVIVRAAVRREDRKLTLFVNFENVGGNAIEFSDFAIDGGEDLAFKFTNTPQDLGAGQRVTVEVACVLMQVTDRIPVMSVSISGKRLELRLPVLLRMWVDSLELDKGSFVDRWNGIGASELEFSVTMSGASKAAWVEMPRKLKSKLGLTPLDFDLPANMLAAAGVIRCFDSVFGLLVRFLYEEEGGQIVVTARGTTVPGLKIVSSRLQLLVQS